MDNRSIQTLELYKILNELESLAVSEQGQKRLKELTPSTDFDEVERRLKETSEGVSILLSGIPVPLSGFYDIGAYVKRAKAEGLLKMQDLLRIADVLSISRKMHGFLNEASKKQHYPIVEYLTEQMVPVPKLEQEIRRCILSEDEMADSASQELFSIRKEIRVLKQRIREKMNSYVNSSTYKKYLQDPIITERNGRYVIPVKQEYRSQIDGIVHDQSGSGATLFIEPSPVVEMGNRVRMKEVEEEEEIKRILKFLGDFTASYGDVILENMELLVALDVIFAKAKLSIYMEGIEPKLNKEGYLVIVNGRHPLIDKEKVVPISLSLGKDFRSLIITGPNTGGKTVTLKTAGLFTLMTQCGLHVPASSGTEMCVFQEVFSDIGDEQSIEQSLSTFSSHMKNLIRILKELQPSSLVLLDELGAGTDPTEGAALAMALLEHLYEKNVRTIATTHYSELKSFAYSHEGMQNGSVEFNVNTLSPTYKLLIGIPGKSNAFLISERLGLSRDIIEQAKEYITTEEQNLEDMLAKIHETKFQAEEELKEARLYKEQFETLKDKYEERMERLAKTREDLLNDAKKEAVAILEDAKQKSKKLIDDINRRAREGLQFQKETASLDRDIKAYKSEMKPALFTKTVSKKEDIRPGDLVYLINFHQKGTVLSVSDSGKEALVQVGIMKINVPLNQMQKETEEKPSKKLKQSSFVRDTSATISPKLDVRGAYLDDAVLRVEKYLDDAYLANLSTVEIVHGKGTGVLREGIRNLLKTHPNVKSFRFGKYNEGGDGVTVVELKE